MKMKALVHSKNSNTNNRWTLMLLSNLLFKQSLAVTFYLFSALSVYAITPGAIFDEGTFDLTNGATEAGAFSVGAQDLFAQGLSFSPDGLRMFITGSFGDDINQYSLSTPFDITTASFDNTPGNPFSIAAQEAAPTDLSFSTDGLRLFVIGSENDEINQYSLTTPFDITTASFDNITGNPFSVATQEDGPTGLTFSTDGLRLFVIGFNGDEINQYSLSTPFDITTASFDNIPGNPFSVATMEGAPTGLTFSPDGLRLFITGGTGISLAEINQYSLSTPFDITTASFDDVTFSVGTQVPGPTGLTFSSDGTRFFVIGLFNDSITQYDLVILTVDLAIIKTNGVNFVTGEQNITYSIEVTNLSDQDTEATVEDLLPDTLLNPTWECIEIQVGSGATCTPGPVFNDIVDDIFLPADTGVRYTLTVTPDVTATDTVSNTATVIVTSGLPDIDNSNNTATDSDPVADIFADGFEGNNTTL